MAYKTTNNVEFKSKGFVDLNTLEFISSDKKDAGQSYSIKEVFSKIGSDGDEIEFSVKKKEVLETVDTIEE